MNALLPHTRRRTSSVQWNALDLRGGSYADYSPSNQSLTPSGTVVQNIAQSHVYPTSIDFTSGRLSTDSSVFAFGLLPFNIRFALKLKPTYSTMYCHILGKGSGNTAGEWAVSIYDRKLSWNGSHFSDQVLEADVWYDIRIERDAGLTTRAYIDDELVGSFLLNIDLNTTRSFNIGDRELGDPFLQYPTAMYLNYLAIGTL